MNPHFKIVLINHSFQIGYFSRRWELFALQHLNVDVYLLAPVKREWYGDKKYQYDKSVNKVIETQPFDKGNYHRRVFRMVDKKYRGWISPDFDSLLDEIKPDVIYNLGTHLMPSLKQLLELRHAKYPNTKVIAFSMRGPALNLRLKHDKCSPIRWIARRLIYWNKRRLLKYINNNVDAFFCHYPEAVNCFKQEGYNGPIYMQTQVGVNREWFHEDIDARIEIRSKYSIPDDSFVFGSASRFTEDKGIDIILRALPTEGNWKYLMMGSGSDEDKERLGKIIKDRKLENNVIETGMVDWYEMAKYWNAIDCAIHVPLTTEQWEDTFALSAIQPQITNKPIIGNDSGSIPYQVGFDEMIVPEGDIAALNKKIVWAMTHKEELSHIAAKMYQRTLDCFEVQHLNDMFYDTLTEDILRSGYDIKKNDMASYIPKKYE